MASGEPVNWHALKVEEVMARLGTGPDGLSREEARRRLEQYGPNELREEKKRSVLLLFLRQFKSFLVLILLIAVALSLATGWMKTGGNLLAAHEELVDAITITAIIIACAILGFVEEYRSERALELLKEMAAPTARVVRDGEEQVVPARELVPGDIVVLHMGDRVPADLRLIEEANLRIDEAILTGESTPVDKETYPLPEDTPVPDRINMAFSGTTVVYGRGKGVVVATGMETEFGKIAAMVQEMREEASPLEKRMAEVGRWLGVLSLAVCFVVAGLGVLRGHDIMEMVLWGISLAVAAVPEALPAVVTGALAVGVWEMAKRRALVRRLPAVETLGCTSIICSDKTGTMTKGEMTVKRIYYAGRFIEVTGVGYEPKGEFFCLSSKEKVDPLADEGLLLLLRAAALCNDASLAVEDGRYVIRGDTTEGALVVLAAKAGMDVEEERRRIPRIGEVPFTSERKRMTTIHELPDGTVHAYMKGAPEVVLEKCDYIWDVGGPRPITDEDRERIMAANEEMARRALRNLAIAYKPIEEKMSEYDESIEMEDFIFLGIVGMIDPPREEVREAIGLCKKAGIKVSMVTGDHLLTAIAVAKELDMDIGRALTGAELDRLSDEEFKQVVEEVGVYARVSPEHKVRIVDALKEKGHVVAMTGDGINDAPALKKADIGVAMGITGTDVTKEASDMVLADDNFATIVAAVEEGRRIYDNIKKYLAYLMRCNIAEILVMVVAFILGFPLPLTAAQILWVNLTTDGLPALALGLDPAEPDVMARPPRDPKESVFTRDVKLYLSLIPIAMTGALMFTLAFFMDRGELVARSVFFLSMILMELACALNSRSLRKPIWRVGAFKNRFLLASVAVSALMTIPLFYTPILNEAFKVVAIGLDGWLWAIGLSVALFASVEMAKVVAERLSAEKA